MNKILKPILWIFLCLYYSIALIPPLLVIDKRDLYLSFCYFNYLISELFNTNIFIKNDYQPKKTIILHNHVSMYDILISFITQIYYNNVFEFCLKKQVSYVPGIGWWCKIMGFPILNRNKSDINILKNHKTQNSILIYPEGTRFTKNKYLEATRFALMNSIKHSKYSLIPKSTGAFNLIKSGNVKYVTVSILVYFDENGKILNNTGKVDFPKNVMLYNKNYSIEEVPKTSDEFRKWLQNEFYKIDDIKNIKIPKKKIIVKPRLNTLLITFIVSIYPMVLFYFRIYIISFILKYFQIVL